MINLSAEKSVQKEEFFFASNTLKNRKGLGSLELEKEPSCIRISTHSGFTGTLSIKLKDKMSSSVVWKRKHILICPHQNVHSHNRLQAFQLKRWKWKVKIKSKHWEKGKWKVKKSFKVIIIVIWNLVTDSKPSNCSVSEAVAPFATLLDSWHNDYLWAGRWRWSWRWRWS